MAAAAPPPIGSISIQPFTHDATLYTHPVRVTLRGPDGAVRQTETRIAHGAGFFHLPAGEYHVTVEGEGVTTFVKGPYLVGPPSQPLVHVGPIVRGEGVHVVDYEASAWAGPETQSRFTRLEQALDAARQEILSRLGALAATLEARAQGDNTASLHEQVKTWIEHLALAEESKHEEAVLDAVKTVGAAVERVEHSLEVVRTTVQPSRAGEARA